MKLKLITILTFASINIASAGFNGLTIHSRANCINNESISWDWTTDRPLLTVSRHSHSTDKDKGKEWETHTINSEWTITWRSAAVHWGEGTSGGWTVVGWHFTKDEKDNLKILGTETVTDCSIYDGWWDKEKEKEKDKEKF